MKGDPEQLCGPIISPSWRAKAGQPSVQVDSFAEFDHYYGGMPASMQTTVTSGLLFRAENVPIGTSASEYHPPHWQNFRSAADVNRLGARYNFAKALQRNDLSNHTGTFSAMG